MASAEDLDNQCVAADRERRGPLRFSRTALIVWWSYPVWLVVAECLHSTPWRWYVDAACCDDPGEQSERAGQPHGSMLNGTLLPCQPWNPGLQGIDTSPRSGEP